MTTRWFESIDKNRDRINELWTEKKTKYIPNEWMNKKAMLILLLRVLTLKSVNMTLGISEIFAQDVFNALHIVSKFSYSIGNNFPGKLYWKNCDNLKQFPDYLFWKV